MNGDEEIVASVANQNEFGDKSHESNIEEIPIRNPSPQLRCEDFCLCSGWQSKGVLSGNVAVWVEQYSIGINRMINFGGLGL
ncbi:hypothetical protein JTB14_006286 [Gonioctena quinquepunctata]|nr:hypothetical protein JTB14_006286 [Gonioctena quinquepunctata]